MRIVLDTNVLVSSALKQKSIPGMAVLAVERHGGLLKSLAAQQQLLDVVARPCFASLIDPDTRDWLKKLMAAAELARSPSVSRRDAIPPTTSSSSWPSTAMPI